MYVFKQNFNALKMGKQQTYLWYYECELKNYSWSKTIHSMFIIRITHSCNNTLRENG